MSMSMVIFSISIMVTIISINHILGTNILIIMLGVIIIDVNNIIGLIIVLININLTSSTYDKQPR